MKIFPNKAKSFIVEPIYSLPAGSSYLHINFNKLFNTILTVVSELSKEVIILGDFNVNYLNKNDCKDLKDIISLFGCKQLIKKPARVTSELPTLIIIILRNNKSVISSTDAISFSLSDRDKSFYRSQNI